MNVKIGSRTIGDGQRCFIIAEAGVNHNGDIELAKQLIIKAKEAGADCVKFQTFKAERVVTSNAPKANYQLETTDALETQIDMLRQLELPMDNYRELIELCEELNIIFMSTPYNVEDVDFLEEIGVQSFKLASLSIAEPTFLQYVALKNKPMIISTGMATLNEVREGIVATKECGNNDLIILQCTTNYPTALDDVNLRAMITMREEFEHLVGYSDHTQSDIACLAAVSMGACVIEKHFTLDKSLPGPDQSSSYEPIEFKRLVQSIRDVETVLGCEEKKPSKAEVRNIKGMRRSVVAKIDILAGTKIDDSMLTLKRPATGLSPKYVKDLIGKIARRDLCENVFIIKEDVE